jgi:hypothetical protein
MISTNVALPRPLPAPIEHGDFFFPADERREMPLPRAASAAARTHNPNQRHRLRHAFELMAAALLDDEKAGDLALQLRRDDVPPDSRTEPSGAVTELLGNVPAHLGNRRRRGIEISAHQIAPLLGVEFGSNGGRTH